MSIKEFGFYFQRCGQGSIDDYDKLREDCSVFLLKELSNATNQKTIFVTHHLPTFFNYSEKYRHSELNTAFATELFDLIEPSNVDYWIFGHSHEVVPDFKIGKTTLTTNQLGYMEYGEHLNFQSSKVLS